MSLEENKTIIRRLFEAVNNQDLSKLDELIAPDYLRHARQLEGPEDLKGALTTMYRGFPDLHVTIKDIIAEGDKVWVRIILTGTHTGEYHGIAPTGNKFTTDSADIWRIANGKIKEQWMVDDMLDLYKQLGAIKYTEKAKKLLPEDDT